MGLVMDFSHQTTLSDSEEESGYYVLLPGFEEKTQFLATSFEKSRVELQEKIEKTRKPYCKKVSAYLLGTPGPSKNGVNWCCYQWPFEKSVPSNKQT